MNPFRSLSTLLVVSTVFLAMGAAILRVENLVPPLLTFSTFVVILAILTVAHFTWKENFLWASVGVLLAAVSIVFNSLQPQHLAAIQNPFISVPFTILVISDIAGFYVMPVLYLTIYAKEYRKLRTFSALAKLQSSG